MLTSRAWNNMRVLVTGASGLVGRRLVRRLAGDGHAVTAVVHERTAVPGAVEVRTFDLRDTLSVRQAATGTLDVVIHLAAITSGTDARSDPGQAWDVNAAGTVRLCEVLGASGSAPAPLVILASTAEVYGAGVDRPRIETDPTIPCSPYAASKLGAEVGAREVGRRRGLPLIVARLFPHTGAEQDTRFVVPAFARRIREADVAGRREVLVGNLDPIRDFLHVEDVVEAYVALMERGKPGSCYNVASGTGVTIREIFVKLCASLGADVQARVDPGLMRPADIQHLVGDATKLRQDTGWRPRRTLDDVLDEVARAQAH